MAELKACPFCGSEAMLRVSREYTGNEGYDVAYVICLMCNARTTQVIVDGYFGATTTEEDVVKMWNRRADNEAD